MRAGQIIAAGAASFALLAAGSARAGSAPASGEVMTRTVGDTIYAEGATTIIRGIVLAEPDDIMGRRFSAGFYPQVSEDAHYSYHGFARSPGSAGIGYLSGFGDARTLRAAKDKVQLCVSLPATALGVKVCDTEHAYKRTEIAASGADGRRLELTYDGKIGQVVRIGYHERTGTGTANTQKDGTLEFDLATSTIVSYKAVRLEVLSADGGRISYRVLGGPS